MAKVNKLEDQKIVSVRAMVVRYAGNIVIVHSKRKKEPIGFGVVKEINDTKVMFTDWQWPSGNKVALHKISYQFIDKLEDGRRLKP